MSTTLHTAEGNPSAKVFDDKAKQYAASLLKDGKDIAFIVDNLTQNGYDKQEVYSFVTNLHQSAMQYHEQAEKKSAPGELILGIIILLAGIIITASGVGIIAYGAILVGIIKTIRGLANLSR